MKTNFLPRDGAGQIVWLQNFAAKLPLYATKYGLPNTEVTDMTASVACYLYWSNHRNLMDDYMRKLTKYKEELRDGIDAGATPSVVPTPPALGTAPASVAPGILKRATAIAQRIKKHITYTEADGLDLGLIGTEITHDYDNLKPQISVRYKAGHPEIVWTKQGMDGIHLYVDRTNSGSFAFCAHDSKPNYLDNTALPPNGKSEVWQYKVIYVKNDEEVGQFSDVLVVTVVGSL